MMLTKKLFNAFSFAVVFPALSYAAVEITPMNEVVEGDEVKIIGSGFGTWNSRSFVKFTIGGDQNINAEVIRWTDDEITLTVPVFPSVFKEADVNIVVSTGADSPETASTSAKYKVLFNELIQGSILQKKRGFSDAFILNQFDKVISDKKFIGKKGLNDFELIRLKDAGFNDDVIGKLGRHKQYLTIGIASIWLNGTKDLVTSPILRIFLQPKSFFDYRSPLKNIYDLNIGYTTKTSTTDNGSEKKNYLLAGFSYELNRSALLNFGWALVPGDIEGKQSQIYFGLTVDSNILRELGILEKG